MHIFLRKFSYFLGFHKERGIKHCNREANIPRGYPKSEVIGESSITVSTKNVGQNKARIPKAICKIMTKKTENIDCSRGICPVKKTAEIIGKKWTTLIIRDLLSGEKSFSQIEKSLKTISPKVLTERLKLLIQQKIITRKVFHTNPPTTEYKLTKKGKELEKVIIAMAEFGENL